MRYVAAYCLASLSGKEPSAKDLEKILGSVGLDCDASDAKKVTEELRGKNLEEVIAEGKGKLGSVPVGAGPAAGTSAPAAEAAEAPKPAKEEKKEEPEEESDDDMGFGNSWKWWFFLIAATLHSVGMVIVSHGDYALGIVIDWTMDRFPEPSNRVVECEG